MREHTDQPPGAGKLPNVSRSSNFPLRPFVGRDSNITANEDNTHTYLFTTLGDMVKNTKALGYTYQPPGNDDYSAPSATSGWKPWVVFPGIKCTDNTYYIHVALDPDQDGKPLEKEQLPTGKDPIKGYVGMITRLGMGEDNGNGRYINDPIIRRLDATAAAKEVGVDVAHLPMSKPPEKDIWVRQLVFMHDPAKGPSDLQLLEPKDYEGKPGFHPFAVWVYKSPFV